MKNLEVRAMSQNDLERVPGDCKWCVVIDGVAEIAKAAVQKLLN